jgi:thiol:disulfide interchange protein DsbD
MLISKTEAFNSVNLYHTLKTSDMKQLLVMVGLLFSVSILTINAQQQEPVKWKFEVKKINNYEAQVIATATIEEGWKLYGLAVPENGPFATNLVFEEGETYRPLKEVKEVTPSTTKHDEVFDMEVPFFKKTATISQNVRLTKFPVVIKGYVEFMCCNDEMCLPPTEVEFTLEVK